MRNTVVGVLALLCVLGAQAGTITSLNPSQINVRSGEWFLRVNGTGLGSTIVYTGPAGTFTLNVNASDASGVVAWVPQEVVNAAGSYSVVVRNGTIESNPATFTVYNPYYSRFVILVPDVVVVPIRSREGVYVRYDVTTAGGRDPGGQATIDCEPRSGALFPMGTTLVRCQATSWLGERADGQFSVSAIDQAAPRLTIPQDIVVEQNDPDGARVFFETSAFDEIDGEIRPSCDHESGSLFPVGVTPVVCTATDAALNPGVAAFAVTVRGRGRLTIAVPERLLAEADGPDGARVDYEVTAYGTEDPEPYVRCEPRSGSLFRIGESRVDCFAEDRFGNYAEARFYLTVIDSVGPIISTIVDPQYLVPVDGAMHEVRVGSEAIDLVDPDPRCTITGITANEQITPEDWRILSERDVVLRAAHNSQIDDRVYRIEVQCTDGSQNVSTAIANAIVPASGAAPDPRNLSKSRSKRRAGGR